MGKHPAHLLNTLPRIPRDARRSSICDDLRGFVTKLMPRKTFVEVASKVIIDN